MIAIGLTRGAHPAQPRRLRRGRLGATWPTCSGRSWSIRAAQISGRVLGRFEGRYLTYAGIEHAIIVGASRSGKGAGHVVPTLIAWPQSAFVYDRKGELWHITADHRKRFSHVFYFAPTDPNTVRWNPLFEVRKGAMEIADIQNVVGILVDPLGRKAGDLNFWDQSATDFFTAVILHVLYSETDESKNLAQVRRLLINIEPTLHAMMNTQHRHRPDLHARRRPGAGRARRADRGDPSRGAARRHGARQHGRAGEIQRAGDLPRLAVAVGRSPGRVRDQLVGLLDRRPRLLGGAGQLLHHHARRPTPTGWPSWCGCSPARPSTA